MKISILFLTAFLFLGVSLDLFAQTTRPIEDIPINPWPVEPLDFLTSDETRSKKLSYIDAPVSHQSNQYSFITSEPLKIVFDFSGFSYSKGYGKPLPAGDLNLKLEIKRIEGNNEIHFCKLYHIIKDETQSLGPILKLDTIIASRPVPLSKNDTIYFPEGSYSLIFSGCFPAGTSIQFKPDTTDLPQIQPLTSMIAPPMYSVTMALQTTRAQAIIPMPDPGPDPEPDPDPIPETVGSPDRNYILTRTYTSENGVKWQDKIDYFDNMGHPEQSVLVKNSPGYNDLVTLLEYDALGREQKSWLPAIVPDNNGVYTLPGTVMSSSRTSNGNDPSPFSKPVYDGSPLNLIVEQYGPGNDWHANGRSVKTDRMTNLSAADAQVSAGVDVKPQYLTAFIYKATSTGITNEGTYPTGTLHVIRTTDEDNNTSFEFKDKAGRVVLARHINNDSVYDTYRVYNDYGKERIVLPPIASDLLATTGSWEENNNILQKYTYIYKYDAYNRCILKKLPGCEPVYYVYDKADRLIFSQDGMQRERKEWSFSIPDAFGQTVLTGICKNAFDYTSSPLENNVVKATWAKVNNATKGYTVTGVTLETPVVLTANYYDNYEFTGWNAIPDTLAGGSPTKYETASGYGTRHTGGCKGLLTGVLTAKQLPDGTISQDYLYSVMYYDNRSRVIQTKSSNHLGGNEKEYTAYNFTGQPVKMKHVHSAEGKETQTEIYSYTYDHAGRLKTTKHQLNSASETLLVDNEYDELGRLKANKRNGQPNLQTNYTYTIRSWMKSLTGALFNQALYYQDSYAGNTPSYSGNISAMSWTTHADKKRGYKFNYDNLARLKKAAYLEADLANTNYSTSYEYDKHGNIKSLSRNGRTGATTFGTIDTLTLSYNGNQLVKVEDSATDPTLSQSADFKNRIKQPVEYTYDRNGSMKTDLNKGISDISYNSLNLPSKLVIANSLGSATNTYLYAADGKKLNVTMQWGASNSKSTDYVGSKIYENSSLKRILVDGGYIENGVYHYYLQDHLGNNRVVAKADGTVVQTNHYYPFGMAFAEGVQNSNQPFKYNGKELDVERGLNLYDYVARCMDAALGRFTTVDPLAEKYYAWSPYSFCKNNPTNRIDPDGKRDRRLNPGENPGVENRGNNVGKVTATIERVGNSSKVVGRSNEHYGNFKKNPTNISLSISGKMKTSKLATVQVSIGAEFSDKQKSTVKSYNGVAGGFGNGAPENGKYSVDHYRARGKTGSESGYNRDNVSYSYDLNPDFSTGRTDLRIHPDGNNEGTLGCVGLTEVGMILIEFKEILNNTLESQSSIPTNINISNNPNNDGKNKKNTIESVYE